MRSGRILIIGNGGTGKSTLEASTFFFFVFILFIFKIGVWGFGSWFEFREV
ncbi:MAG: hypothetical protein IPL16_03720 [Ignavibacteria bacterium]|nr:hypothetical protein [Ignavibacteria bacterium]